MDANQSMEYLGREVDGCPRANLWNRFFLLGCREPGTQAKKNFTICFFLA
jgi:hypothetical protein